MPDNKPNVSTDIQTVDVNLQALLEGTASAANVLIPDDKKKPGLFSSVNPVTQFLDTDPGDDNDDPNNPVNADAGAGAGQDDPPPPVDDPVTIAQPGADDDLDDDDKGKPGRKKMTKDLMVQVISKMIEKGTLMPFEDDKALDDYSMADMEELLEANFTEREKKIRDQAPLDFFESQPEEMKIAMNYLANGGDDLKGLFYSLAQANEMRDLTPTEDSEEIARRYLEATNFGTEEDIEEEITSWKDLGKLQEKAAKFKPKLDAMYEQIVNTKLQQQEQQRQKQTQEAQKYMENVYKTLEPAEINGLKLDKKTQGMLYTGLVNPSYQSISGRNTNLLGHLLEKYQIHEPNHALIAEALWLLNDPDGYRSKVRESAEKTSTEKTVRALKIEQGNKNSSSTGAGDDDRGDGSRKPKPNAIKRDKGFFAR